MLRVIVRNSLLTGALCACAPLATEPTVETVDEHTGVTVARIVRPVELLLDGRGGSGDPFAFLAPFETNRMGNRALYLWTAVPQGPAGTLRPVLMVDGETLSLIPVDAQFEMLGLSREPYTAPTPWSVANLFSVERSQLERLARATRAELLVEGADGTALRYAADASALALLPEFMTRTAE